MTISIEKFCKQVFREAQKLSHEEVLSQAKEIHPEYDYSKFRYINNKTPFTVICPKHNFEWETTKPVFLGKQKSGCPICAKEKSGKRYKDKKEKEFFDEVKRTHPNYDFSKFIYSGADEKGTVICPIHGEFQIPPSKLKKGEGCKDCYFDSKRKPLQQFIKDAQSVFPEYDYSKVSYKNNDTPVTVICPIHGEFQRLPQNLLAGTGCKECSREQKRIEVETRILKAAREFHPEYDYSKFHYVNQDTKVTVICPKTNHGEFEAWPLNLAKGIGCPVCSESKGEVTIRNWLTKHKVAFEGQKRFKDLGRYSFDFYIPTKEILIEYNGIQHYEEKEFFHRKAKDFQGQLVRDHLKKSYAERKGYRLIVIPYWDFKNIDKILSDSLLSV